MNRRTTRHFGELDKAEFLRELKVFRAACIRVCTKAPIGSEEYRLADRLISEILVAGEKLTGERDYFVLR
jgi:hypothetical protein